MNGNFIAQLVFIVHDNDLTARLLSRRYKRLGALFLSICLDFFESFHSIHPDWVLMGLQLSLSLF